MKRYLLLTLLTLAITPVSGQTKITASEAVTHLGQTVTILDKVRGCRVLTDGKTLLQLGEPQAEVVVVIPAKDRSAFRIAPEKQLRNRLVLVTGKLGGKQGRIEMVVTGPAQLTEVPFSDPGPEKLMIDPKKLDP